MSKKKIKLSLMQQVYNILTGMQAFGESRYQAKRDGTARKKIFSFGTFVLYKRLCGYFVRYIRKNYPEVSTLLKAKKYLNEYLESLVEQEYSPNYIKTIQSALNKLYQIKPDDPDRFVAPPCSRANIKNNRPGTRKSNNFSLTKNADLVHFAQSTGLRRSEFKRIRGRDLYTKDQIEDIVQQMEDQERPLEEKEKAKLEAFKLVLEFHEEDYFVYVKRGKGGRIRLAPIIGPYKEQTIERMRNTAPDERVWPRIPSAATIHAFRADYAEALYKKYARPIESIPYDKYNKGIGHWYQGDVYVCRRDLKGLRLDRRAMQFASWALGHKRVSVVAGHYLYNLES